MEGQGSGAPRRHWIADGGWALLIGGIILTFGMVFRIYHDLGPARVKRIGDGVTIDSYQFDLSNLTIDSSKLRASTMSRDGIAALVEPGAITAAGLRGDEYKGRAKYVVKNDRVAGVVVGGEARAYPLLVLNWHEVVNDTLGGVPIAVTYSPFTDSIVVFDRRVGADTLEFGVSGLFYNSNLLLYDRNAAAGQESLWSQLLSAGISGPHAGAELTVLSSNVLEWQDWLAAYPDTTILRRDENLVEQYKGDLYGNYFQSGKLRFDASPLPPDAIQVRYAAQVKSRCLVLSADEDMQLLTYDSVLKQAHFDDQGLGSAMVQAGSRVVTLSCRRSTAGFAPDSVWLPAGAREVELTVPTVLLFGWYSTHPDWEGWVGGAAPAPSGGAEQQAEKH
jgi:hypothetical protein